MSPLAFQGGCQLLEAGCALRVSHLIHHTAGLPGSAALWESMEQTGETDWASNGVIAALATVPELASSPGATYDYSNAGYICLARILERVTGEGLATFAQQQLLDPAGMSASLLWSGPDPHPPAARLPEPPRPPQALSLGDGGLWTTVRDLLRWNDALRWTCSGSATCFTQPEGSTTALRSTMPGVSE